MGMDVIGKAKDENGEEYYFRRNVWGWRPLANMLLILFPKETAACKYWQLNDGDGLNAEQSIALADAIDAALADGRIEDYVAKRNADVGEYSPDDVKTWYSVEVQDAREFSAFLRGCGGFNIW